MHKLAMRSLLLVALVAITTVSAKNYACIIGRGRCRGSNSVSTINGVTKCCSRGYSVQAYNTNCICSPGGSSTSSVAVSNGKYVKSSNARAFNNKMNSRIQSEVNSFKDQILSETAAANNYNNKIQGTVNNFKDKILSMYGR